VVTFVIHDGKLIPLKISDLDGYPSFIIVSLKEDATSKLTQWVSYTTGDVKGAPYTFEGKTIQPVLEEVKGRPVFDPKATTPAFPADHPAFKDLGNGTFAYTFSTALPADFDRNATHRVGGQITRATRTFASNPVFDFVPAGGAVKVTRNVVTTASCNQCHDPLALHGGSRVETALCVTCHTSQNIDPETGTNVELKSMVHKIHKSATLPSVVAGGDYRIVGFNQTVLEPKITWPQYGAGIGDVRTCTTCHGAPPVGMKAEDYAKLAPDADNWKTKPSRTACGACHDNIDWATGKSTITGKKDHAGGPQPNDAACAVCHQADTGKEFDASVVGAHTIPDLSKQVKGINVDILRVTNTAPGQTPNVIFTAKDNSGKNLQLSEITSMTFNINGPTTDYLNQPTTESATLSRVSIGADGNFAYTLTRPIANNATGTYAIGIEARRTEAIIGNEGATANVSSASGNPVFYIPVTDKEAVPRRQIVSTENCNVCHEKMAFHGGGRLNLGEYCQFCHNPATVDVPGQVPASFGGPFTVAPESINFKLLIHRIHTGEELTRDFTIYRTRGVFNFNEIGFPGDASNCSKCHVGDSYTLPLPETAANTVAPREFYSPLGPAAAACLGCHDSQTAGAHAATQKTATGEACAICHGKGKDFDVQKVH
jgi:OmcA/MtrC family decaheme c-type cytochrome